VTQNVSSDGTTSTVKKAKGITWVKEESNGSSAWYGFEDPSNVLPAGTRLSVKWDELDKNYHWDIFNMLSNNGLLPEKVWRFNLQALDPNNDLIHYFDHPLNIYIEIGEDWDENEITGLYLKLGGKIGDRENWNVRYETIEIEGKNRKFAVISPTHFSDYYLADPTTGKDVYENYIKKVVDRYSKWLEANPDSTKNEQNDAFNKIQEEELNNLTPAEREALEKYLEEEKAKTDAASVDATTTKTAATSQAKNSSTTKTGDIPSTALLSMLMVGSLAGIGPCLKKKKN
jgi:hypothetical protein